MTPILFAFLAIMAPAAVVLGGLAFIKRMARWREARTKKAQDMEFAAHDERLARMNQIADRAAGMKKPHQQSSLRVVPKQPAPCSEPEEIPVFGGRLIGAILGDTYPGSAAANPFGYGMPTFDSPAPAASLQGNGGSFDGGGASADWSPSCSPSSDSGSSDSDSGSCGTGD